MSNHYAIEMSLMLYQDDVWVRSFTYYNHGIEPPFGGVRSEAADSVVLTIQEFEANVESVDSWIGHVIDVVKTIKPIPRDGTPDMPIEYKVNVINDSLVYEMAMESMEVTIVYDKTAETVTFASRDAFDVSWRGFLFHHETVKDFLVEIKEL